MSQSIPLLKDRFETTKAILVPALATNLASTSKPVQKGARGTLDAFIAHTGAPTIVPTLVNVAVHGNPRVKAAVFNCVGDLVEDVASARPATLTRHVLPGVLQVIDGCKGDVQAAVHRVLRELLRTVGPDLVRQIESLSASSGITASGRRQAVAILNRM